jgi:hypothetical protein
VAPTNAICPSSIMNIGPKLLSFTTFNSWMCTLGNLRATEVTISEEDPEEVYIWKDAFEVLSTLRSLRTPFTSRAFCAIS